MGGGALESQGARATGWAERKPRSSPTGRKRERDVPTPWGLRGATRELRGTPEVWRTVVRYPQGGYASDYHLDIGLLELSLPLPYKRGKEPQIMVSLIGP